MLKVAVFGATLTGNKGAEAMFTSIAQNLPQYIPVSKIFLFSYYQKDDQKISKLSNIEIVNGNPLFVIFIFPIIAFFFRLFYPIFKNSSFENKTIEALVTSDIFIDIAGVSFVDGREKYLPFNIGCILPALLLGKPVFKLSQAMGSFNNPINKMCAKIFLPLMTGLVSRGKVTSSYLNNMNINDFIEASDLAFSTHRSSDHAVIHTYFSPYFLSRDIIGISPSAEVWLRCRKNNINYSKILAEFTNFLINNKNLHVILIPHSLRRYTVKLKNNDLPICKEIMEMIEQKDKCILVSDELSFLEIRQIVSVCRYIIVSRFHAMISALLEKKPLIVCGWSHKYSEVLNQFDLDKQAIDYSDISYEKLVNAFDALKQDEEQIIKKLNDNLPDVINSSGKNYDYIKNLLTV